MRIIRLRRVLLAMTSKVHPGVLLQGFECTCSCARYSGAVGRHRDALCCWLRWGPTFA
ncbi:hypothetical protein C8R48DRAFT_742348 [Suillus tomentosus]|nr:hypothetical protein C8R48DRAFT_742348 [Suillus tomentosus]